MVAAAAIVVGITMGLIFYFSSSTDGGMQQLLDRQRQLTYDYLEEMEGRLVSGSVVNSLIMEHQGQMMGFVIEEPGGARTPHLYPTTFDHTADLVQGRSRDRFAVDEHPVVNCKFNSTHTGAPCLGATIDGVYTIGVLYGVNDQPIGLEFIRED
jgi:hypothetical protein